MVYFLSAASWTAASGNHATYRKLRTAGKESGGVGEHCEQPPQLGTRLLCASREGPGGCPGPRPSRLESRGPVLEATRIRFDSRHALFCVSAFPCCVSSAAAVILILRADAHGSPHPKLRRRSPVAMSYSVCASLALGLAGSAGSAAGTGTQVIVPVEENGMDGVGRAASSLRIGETRRGGGAQCRGQSNDSPAHFPTFPCLSRRANTHPS